MLIQFPAKVRDTCQKPRLFLPQKMFILLWSFHDFIPMQKILPFLLVLILAAVSLPAQNSNSFFKALPLNAANLPDWAEMMYSEDPNVFAVDEAFHRWYQTHAFEKNLHTQNYKHWRWQVEDLMDENGLIRRPSPEEERRIEAKLRQRVRERKAGNRSNTEWTSMGPFETYRNGTLIPWSQHKNIYSIDQSASNPDILICGTEAGGVYRSIDHGLNWSLITKNEVFAGGNTAVKIHPSNPDILLVAANQRIYRSTNAGQTWAEQVFLGGSGYDFKFHPTDHDTVFLAADPGLFRSIDSGINWTLEMNLTTWDVDFHPVNPDTMFVLRENSTLNRAEVFRTYDLGGTWTLVDNGWLLPSNPSDANAGGGKIAISAASPDMVYACLIGQEKTGDEGWIGIFRSTNLGDSWVDVDGQAGSPYGPINGALAWNVAAYSGGYHQGFYNFDFEVSESDPGKLWVATIRLSESADSGRTFQSIGAANSTRLTHQHADVQDIEVNGNDIWIASDGGIDYSADQLMTASSRKRGIQASHFWGFNVGWNEDVFIGGRYHDGTVTWFEGWGPGETHVPGGVEEPSGYVHPIESRRVMYRTHYSSNNTTVVTIPPTLGGAMNYHPDIPLRPNESYSYSRSSGVYFHPYYAEVMYVGLDGTLWKSRNGGSSFTSLANFGGGGVYEMEIAPSDPEVMYVVYNAGGQAGSVQKTTDGGISWNPTTNIPGNRNRIELSINPANADEVWVGLGSGANGAKVFRTLDGGSTWQNMSSAQLNGETVRDILFQGGTNGHVYVATLNTVFHYDPVSLLWTDYGLGLPLIAKSWAIRPFYRDGKLRLGTAGRGVFDRALADTNFVPVAWPMTYTDTSYCPRDTIQFDCHSVLHHAGASWTWTINPAPTYISSPNARNPRVVFGGSGSYDVSLTVTDRNNNSSTRMVPGMVTVLEECNPDSIPGMALLCSNGGDNGLAVNIPATSVDSFTFSAWVRPNGIQPDYSGIVMTEGVATGMNFRGGNNTLGYHAPGGSWSWNSNLIVPAGEWSHVAMVATPSSVTLYLNGIPSEHLVNLSPADLSELRVGSYQGWNSRNFRGLIDEVCIWDRALSRDEIRQYRHLTKEDLVGSDAHLIAYYQFNADQNGRIADHAGLAPLALSGYAQLRPSTAPVGGGVSAKETITFAGIYSFGFTGIEIEVPGATPYPGGEVWASRINLAPDSVPGTFNPLPYYWILNNYGTNATFSPLDGLRLSPYGQTVLPGWTTNPEQVRLYQRIPENGFVNNWSEICRAAQVSAAGPLFEFGDSCAVGTFGQFFLAADTTVIVAVQPEPVRITHPQVFPNPLIAGEALQIRLPEDVTAGRFTLFTVEGKLAGDWILRENATTLALPEEMAAGMYMWRIRTEREIFSGKLLRE